MAVFKKRRTENFTTIHNHSLKNNNLSWKAKGILAYIMSLPEDWEIHTKELMKHASDGRDSLMSGIKELREHGYVDYKKYKDDDTGKFIHNYDVYDEPQTGNPEVENPTMDNPTLENPSVKQSTNELRTKELKTNNTNTSGGYKEKYPPKSKLDRDSQNHIIYPEKYEELYEAYPKREGSTNKGGGYKSFRARIKEGIPYEKLLKGVENYYIDQSRKRNLETRYVKQIKTFLGNQDIWLEYAEKDMKTKSNSKPSTDKKERPKISDREIRRF